MAEALLVREVGAVDGLDVMVDGGCIADGREVGAEVEFRAPRNRVGGACTAPDSEFGCRAPGRVGAFSREIVHLSTAV